MSISKERRKELRDWCQMNALAAPMHRQPTRGEVLALLDKADELDAIKAARQAPDPAADLPGAECNGPHAPTVAAALREWVRVAREFDDGLYDCATLEEALEMHADELEGREDG